MRTTNVLKRLIAGCLAFIGATALAPCSEAQTPSQQRQAVNIILVHGAWADGSSWSKVIPLLTQRGFNVVAIQNPLTTLADDVTTTQQAIQRVEATNPGPVLLVGHSYGGTIITQAGLSAPDVKGLVYVAAFAPDNAETSLGLAGNYPAPGATELSVDSLGFSTQTRTGMFEDFAQDLSTREKETLLAAQGPTALVALQAPVTSVAWRQLPSWFVVAGNDRAISPDLERMEAARMNATTITIPTSHVAMLAEPSIVADFIAIAARSIARK